MTKLELLDLQRRVGAGEYNNDIKGQICVALAAYAASLVEDAETEEVEVDEDADPSTPPVKTKRKKGK